MPEGKTTKPIITIKIDGSPVSDAFKEALDELVVNSDLHLPGMFSIRILDDDLSWISSSLIALGKSVTISMAGLSQSDDTGETGSLISGEITALEPEYSEDGQAKLTIRGYDKAHRLHRGKKTRTFLQQKESDVVSTIAGEAGLTPDVDSTGVQYDYLLQNNQTNWEFLQERARRLGYWVYVTSGKLCFKKATATLLGTGPTLTWGDNLYSFRPRLSGAQQADNVKVEGWNSKTREAIASQATPVAPANQGGVTTNGGADAKTAFGGTTSEAVVVDLPIVSVDDAAAIATGLAERISRDYLWAEGECLGDPEVQAGAVVTIELEVGKKKDSKFGGKYLVTSATHTWDGTDYRTHFTITGQDPYTLSALLGADGDTDSRVPGVVTAVVTNLNDPDKLGRAKVKFPWMGKSVSGTDIESDWVRLSSPMAGGQRGLLSLPEVNDEVLVAFEQGDPDFPFIVGGLWNSTDKPPVGTDVAVKDGKVIQRVFKTRTGHIITLDDSDDKPLISIVDKTGKNKVVIDSSKNTITINSDSNMTFEAANGDIAIKGKNVNIESQQNTSIKATQNINLEATQNATLKGTQNVNVEATMNLDLKGTAGAKLESTAQAEVSGSAMLTLKGGMVKIN
jgi:uncharacterized protein involved in type VI secretion and phage assembly